MEIFKIEITETLTRIIEVEAECLDDAVVIAGQQYKDEDIVLDSSDMVTSEIKAALVF